jgi:hypothetical protein
MDNVQNILGINSADNMFDSTLIVANKDGSIIERLEYLQGSPIQERCIEKSDGGVLNGADPLFTITGGPILVTSIVGIVTTVIAGGAVTVALSTTVAITDDAAGTSYRFVGAGGVLTPDTNGAKIIDPVTVGDCAFLIPIGNINFLGSAARTGNIKWYMIYKPLSPNSVVTVAV